MFLGFLGGMLGTTGKYVDKGRVGGQIGIDLPAKVPQAHKQQIKNATLPDYATAGMVLKQAQKTAREEANAGLLGRLKNLKIRELNAHLKSYEHHAEFAKAKADVAVQLANVDSSVVKHFARQGLALDEERVEVDAFAQQYQSNRSLFSM